MTLIRMCCAFALDVLAALAVVLAMPGAASADPHAGVGVFAGLAAHNGDVALANGGASGFLSAGLDLGGEYQWVLSREFTLAALAQTSAESVSGDAAKTYTFATHNILAPELRYWNGAKFVAIHAGAYAEALTDKSGKLTQATGWGLGLAGGWEGEAGWFWEAQLDLAQVAYVNAVHGLTGARVHVGYRWGR
jgi:hypothetical protein